MTMDYVYQHQDSGLNAELINSDFGLEKIRMTYNTLLPCLTLLLTILLTAQNDYEPGLSGNLIYQRYLIR